MSTAISPTTTELISVIDDRLLLIYSSGSRMANWEVEDFTCHRRVRRHHSNHRDQHWRNTKMMSTRICMILYMDLYDCAICITLPLNPSSVYEYQRECVVQSVNAQRGQEHCGQEHPAIFLSTLRPQRCAQRQSRENTHKKSPFETAVLPVAVVSRVLLP